MRPTKVSLTTEGALSIVWDDGSSDLYPMSLLRKKCPCAQCGADRRERGPTYIPLYTRDALTLEKVTPMGYYALQLVWHDGHSTGIFTHEYLKEIAPHD